MPNLAEQIREALSMFARNDTAPALTGGLAVAAHQVVRATKDVDFLVAAEAADKVHAAQLDLGYQRLHHSEDAANYVRAAQGMRYSDSADPLSKTPLNPTGGGAVLASEAGITFQPMLGKTSGVDPFDEWLSLMEVVQMLCPVWPARDAPMQGDHWLI